MSKVYLVVVEDEGQVSVCPNKDVADAEVQNYLEDGYDSVAIYVADTNDSPEIHKKGIIEWKDD